MAKKNEWKHPKQKELFASSYKVNGEDRVFQLTNGRKVISFESWQRAVADGWVKLIK